MHCEDRVLNNPLDHLNKFLIERSKRKWRTQLRPALPVCEDKSHYLDAHVPTSLVAGEQPQLFLLDCAPPPSSPWGQQHWVAEIWNWIDREGGATKMTKIIPDGGGCINSALRYGTDSGSFFSWRQTGMFRHSGLKFKVVGLIDTDTICVPKLYKVGHLLGRGSFITVEHISLGSSIRGQTKVGRKLVDKHIARRTDSIP